MSLRRILLMPLVPVYAAVVLWKRRMFRLGRLRSRGLEGVVISVGSLSAGGAGKTPMVLLLAELLERRGYGVRILTRGYGRGSREVERVDTAGDARRFGDEPLLLARRSGVPVYVGADRYRAGRMAEVEAGAGGLVCLLDDGFQHGRLRRDVDVVLLTRLDVEDVLLPAGNLREPLWALREADVVVLREEEAESLGELVSGLVREGTPVWRIRRRLRFGAGLPRRPVAFCGIARPEGFFTMLKGEGMELAGTVVFRDHHWYEEVDVERLLRRARAMGADGFCTTEKDAVKLDEGMRRRLEGVGAVVVPELRVELLEEQAAMDEVISMIDRRRVR